jgi:hypothetical protein
MPKILLPAWWKLPEANSGNQRVDDSGKVRSKRPHMDCAHRLCAGRAVSFERVRNLSTPPNRRSFGVSWAAAVIDRLQLEALSLTICLYTCRCSGP